MIRQNTPLEDANEQAHLRGWLYHSKENISFEYMVEATDIRKGLAMDNWPGQLYGS
jgi:hypothetical protein